MATTAQYTYEEISNTQIKIKVTKTDSNFTQYRIFAYTESGTRIHQEDYTTAKAVAGITISGFVPGQNYKINVGPGTDDGFDTNDQIGKIDFTKNVLLYKLQFYYQQDGNFLPVTKIEYSLNNRSWTNIDFSATNTAGVTISDNLSVDEYVYIKITKEANTTVTGWYVATDGTIRNSYSTGTNTVTYRYEYDSNDYAMQVNMRAVFQAYRYRIAYNTFPYLQYAENQQKVPSSIVGVTGKLIDEVNFYSKYNYLIYYPEYQEGRDGIGWSTIENSSTATYQSGTEKSFTGIKNENFSALNDTITLYPVYKNKYTININLYKNDGTSSSNTTIYNSISLYRNNTGQQYLSVEEILDIHDISPTREGYFLQGYATSSNGNLVYSFESFTSQSWLFQWKTTVQTYKLYAVWAKKYYASFTLYGKGGLFADGQDTNYLTNDLSIGSTKKVPDLPEPTRDGYKLIGWSLDWQTGASVDYELGSEFEYSESGKNYTLYAVWAKTYHYKVTYKSGAGKWSNGTTELIDEADTQNIRHWYSLTSNTPISNTTDYVFKAWSDGYNDFTLPTGLYLEFSDTNDSIELTYTAKYGKATEDGVVYINGKPYIPYIYSTINGVADWRQYEAHIYSSGWKISIE